MANISSIYIFAVFVLFVCLATITHGQLPSYMKACHRNDPDLDGCVLKVTKDSIKKFSKGDKERGFLRTDPMRIKEIRTAAFGTRNTGINILFTDVNLRGLRNLEIQSFHVDLKKRSYDVVATTNLTMDSKYDLKGRLLIFPLTGNGKALIDLQNVKLRLLLKQGIEIKNDLQYTTVEKIELKHEIQAVKIKLDNLFNGDRVLGDTTNRLLNDNWREVLAEIGGPIIEEIRKQLFDLASSFFSQVPLDELYLPD